MSNSSILIVGIATALLLCGGATGIAIACMNNESSVSAEEQAYTAAYDDAWEAALAKFSTTNPDDGPVMKLGLAASLSKVSDEPIEPTLITIEQYAQSQAYRDAMSYYYYGVSDSYNNDYQEYLDYYQKYLESYEQYLIALEEYNNSSAA